MATATYRSTFLRCFGNRNEAHDKTYLLHPTKMVVRWSCRRGLASGTEQGEDVIQLVTCVPDYSTRWEDRMHWSFDLPFGLDLLFAPFQLFGVRKVAEVSFGESLQVRQSDQGTEAEFRAFVREVEESIRRLQGDHPVQLTRVIK